MTTTRRRSSTAIIPAAAIELATSTLNELPEKPKETWSLRDAVEQMRDTITSALSKGYTHEEIAHRLTQQGVEISVPSLRYYLTRAKKKAEPTAVTTLANKTRKPRESKANAAPDAAMNAAPVTEAIAPEQDSPTVPVVVEEPTPVAIAPSSSEDNGAAPAASNGRARKPAAAKAAATTTATSGATDSKPATPRRGRPPAAEAKTTGDATTKIAAKKKPQSTAKAKTTKSPRTGTATASVRRKKPAAE